MKTINLDQAINSGFFYMSGVLESILFKCVQEGHWLGFFVGYKTMPMQYTTEELLGKCNELSENGWQPYLSL